MDTIKNAIIEHIHNIYKNFNISYIFHEKDDAFTHETTIKGYITKVFETVLVHSDGCTICTALPFRADTENTEAMERLAAFISHENFTENGVIEMDYDTGEIHFKYYLDCADIVPAEEDIVTALFIISVMINQFTDTIFSIAYRGATCEEASEQSLQKLFNLKNGF